MAATRWVPGLLACTSICAATLTFTWAERWAGVIAATAFACIEFSWYSLTTELESGEVIFTPFSKTCRGGHTTVHQFLANIFWTPVLLFTYYNFLPNPIARVMFFPFNVWLLEIVEGYALMTFHKGRNPAWTYATPDAYFHGNVRTGFAKLWFALGLILELGGREAVRQSGEELAAVTAAHSCRFTALGGALLLCLLPRLLRE